MISNIKVSEPRTVAEQINQFHATVERLTAASREGLNESLHAAWNAGRLLQQEKQRIGKTMGRGAWLHWLEANFSATARNAQRYMALANQCADSSFVSG